MVRFENAKTRTCLPCHDQALGADALGGGQLDKVGTRRQCTDIQFHFSPHHGAHHQLTACQVAERQLTTRGHFNSSNSFEISYCASLRIIIRFIYNISTVLIALPGIA